MRLAILSDIHGNFRALEAVLADIDREGARGILSLGDNIGYGPEPEEVITTLMAREVVSVMGNHELGIVSRSAFNRFTPSARESLELTRRMLSPLSFAWIDSLPPALVRDQARFVHGCPPDSMTVYLFSPGENRLQRLFATYAEPLCFAGHTHSLHLFQQLGAAVTNRQLAVERVRLERGSRAIFLCGSVGQPRDSLSREAKYLLWDQERSTVEVRALAYDVDTTIRLLGERGFPAINARRLR